MSTIVAWSHLIKLSVITFVPVVTKNSLQTKHQNQTSIEEIDEIMLRLVDLVFFAPLSKVFFDRILL